MVQGYRHVNVLLTERLLIEPLQNGRIRKYLSSTAPTAREHRLIELKKGDNLVSPQFYFIDGGID